MNSVDDHDQQVERALEKATLLRQGSYFALGCSLYIALVLRHQNAEISLPAWFVWETSGPEIKAIMYLSVFAALQAVARNIELDVGHDNRWF